MSITSLEQMRARFAPVDLEVPIDSLSAGNQAALVKLIHAARVLNNIYLDQVWTGNAALYKSLLADKSDEGRIAAEAFWLNKGPWSPLDDHQAFLPGVPARKPAGAAFYPEDLSQDEFDAWVATLQPEPQRQALGFFSVIRRGPEGLLAVPYSQAYGKDLASCGELLLQAARLTEDVSLRRFLTLRARAFQTDDYYESDLAWMDLESALDITIGPYETYTDELYGYKAAFEAYIGVLDHAETQRFTYFGNYMQELEDNLPMDARFKNPSVGSQSPLRVVNLVYAAGDADHGVKTAAFNLPNDENVITQKGTRRVMLKNVQEAKFRSVLTPIAAAVLSPDALPDVQFDSFFQHILTHEMGHGIGPQQIVVRGRASTPRQELKELYSAIEEVKADILGLYILQYFADKRYIELNTAALYTTYLASSFRTLRFGLHEAHGKGMAIQFNHLLDAGAFVRHDQGWKVNESRMRSAVRDLAHQILTMEATGDYQAAKDLCESAAVLRPEIAVSLEAIRNVPVDIDSSFVTAERIAPVS